jgi:hypothetical protein
MLALFERELKIAIGNKLIVAAAVLLVGAMYMTQWFPKEWYWYSWPLDEMNYNYLSLKEDYEKGVTSYLANPLLPALLEEPISKEKTHALLEAITTLSPDYVKGELHAPRNFAMEQEEFNALMDGLDIQLGGNSAYGEFGRNLAYGNYTSAFNSERIADREVLISLALNAVERAVKTAECRLVFDYLPSRTKSLSKTDTEYVIAHISEAKASGDASFIESALDDIDEKLGGNTEFSEKNRTAISSGISLERQRAFFQDILNEGFTNPYARYLSDYMSILAGILPPLFAAFAYADIKRFKVNEMVEAKPVPSWKLAACKHLAITCLFSVIFFAVAAVSTGLFLHIGAKSGIKMDVLAFFKYTAFWVMPTVVFTVSMSMLISFATGSSAFAVATSIFVLFTSMFPLIEGYSWYRPIIRHNDIEFVIFNANISSIAVNRICTTVFAFILLLVCGWIIDIRRNAWKLKAAQR